MRTAVRIGAQRPTWFVAPTADSYESGDDAIEFGRSLGLDLFDWQRWCVRHICAERADGSLAATSAGLVVPRQAGKNSVVEVVELYGLYVVGLRSQIHSAHNTDTAAKHMARLKWLIEQSPELDAITTIYEANGKERIVNRETGGVVEFSTRLKTTKRGSSPQRIVFDEALYLEDVHLQAMVPALAAQSMDPDTAPQIIYLSSAPLAESTVLHRLRDSARSDHPPSRMFFAAWEASSDVDVHDRDAWYAVNPGLGLLISEEWVADTELSTLSPEAFRIERLGVPEPGANSIDNAAIPADAWAASLDELSSRGEAVAFGVDVSPDRKTASIGAASMRFDGVLHVELAHTAPGSAWLLPRLLDMWERWKAPVAIDPSSAAGSLIADLIASGAKVLTPSRRDVAAACGRMHDLVVGGKVAHVGQAQLDVAVAGAVKRPVGDAWVFDRRAAAIDLTPLYAVTLASAGAVTEQPKKYRTAAFR